MLVTNHSKSMLHAALFSSLWLLLVLFLPAVFKTDLLLFIEE